MRTYLLGSLLVLGTTTLSFGQGVVSFNLVQFEPPRIVTDANGNPLYGSAPLEPATFVAQLYWSTDQGATFTVHTAAPARFRSLGTGFPGTWAGGTRTLPVGGVGTTVQLQVRAWDSSGGLTYEQAVAAGR